MNQVSHAVVPVFFGGLHPIVAKNVVDDGQEYAIMPVVVDSTDHQG